MNANKVNKANKTKKANKANKRKKQLKQNKSKGNLKNIKSTFILKKVLNNVPKNRWLDIIRHNKKIQNRLNLNINDYKEFCDIELEIIPYKRRESYCGIINIGYQKEYYHIYFDDDKNEIKRTGLTPEDNVSKIKIVINYPVKDFEDLFYECNYIKAINFTKFNRSNITNMECMFCECSYLKELNLSNFNTKNVTNMDLMFGYCSYLKKLDISNFNTKNVTSMRNMFCFCNALEEIKGIENFNTNNVTYMDSMFYSCRSLKELDISNFKADNVKRMTCMFRECISLKKINLPYFNFKNDDIDVFWISKGCSEKIKKKIKKYFKSVKLLNKY